MALALLPCLAVWLGNGLYFPFLIAAGPTCFWTVDLLQWIVMPAAIAFVLLRFAGLAPRDYGYGRPAGHGMEVAGDAVGVFITVGLALFLARQFTWLYLDPPFGTFSWGGVFPAPGLLRNVTVLYASVTAGVVESAAFISLPWLLFQTHVPRASRVLFALLTSAVFGVAHLEQGLALAVGAAASNLVACFWYFHYRNLWPVAAGHCMIDLLAFA